MRARYQKGSLTKIKRKNGYSVWLFRWRETGSDGSRRPRNIVVGPVSELRTEADARRALETLRLNINHDHSEQARPPRNFRTLVDHYRLKELVLQNDERKAYSTKKGYESYLNNWLVPRWGEYMLARMENGIAVHVEEWLGTITRSRGTKAKLRNIMSAVVHPRDPLRLDGGQSDSRCSPECETRTHYRSLDGRRTSKTVCRIGTARADSRSTRRSHRNA